MSDPLEPTLHPAEIGPAAIPIDPDLLSPQPPIATLDSAMSASTPLNPTLSAQGLSTLQSDDETGAKSNAEATPSAARSGLPQFTPFVPNTSVNGRRISTGGNKGANGQHRSVGPELSTPSKLSQVSGGTFIPTAEPPYEPPEDIVYPPDRILNPYWGSMSPQPIIENFPANSLYRPMYLPLDIDERLDKKSVWIGIEKDSSRAVYFLPPTCQCCKNPAVAQHCDRGWPNCARCIGRGVTCIPGKAWGMMRPKGKRRNLKAEAAKSRGSALQAQNAIYDNDAPGPSNPTPTAITSAPIPTISSSSIKGKGKATVHHYIAPPPLPDLSAENQHIEAMDIDDQIPHPKSQQAQAESKATKKRKISMTIEGDHKRIRRKSNQDTTGPLPLSSSNNLPLSRSDQEYFLRLELNAKRPPLSNMNGPCPVWAKTRRSLQVAAEYLREPIKTNGASVEIGVGGVARGIILEGQVTDAQGIFWGTGEDTGTIITAIGHPRKPKSDSTASPDDSHVPSRSLDESDARLDQRRSTPPLNILPSILNTQHTSHTNGNNRFSSERKPVNGQQKPQESPEISALLMAQRARTPIAVAVAQDYSPVPFKVPRPFIVLGWFWITDAWVEPVLPDLKMFTPDVKAPSGPPELVIWKFRFSWCTASSQGVPWWSSTLEPTGSIHASFPVYDDEQWQISGPESGSSTISHLPPVSQTFPGAPPKRESKWRYQYECGKCRYASERVYDKGDICLNEDCEWFFQDASDEENRIIPSSNRPSPLPIRERISPDSLGLRLRPPQPIGITYDVTQSHAGREFWRGWVCTKCSLAQERCKWAGWCCEACGYSISPPRRVYTAEDLRPPSRPVCISTRQDDGYASFPYEVQRSWSLFHDDLKVIKHSLDPSIFGNDSEVQHVLAHEGKDVNKLAGEVLRGLQVQGKDEVPLRRYITASTTRRPVELTLSPFYTFLCGSDPFPVSGFTTHRSVSWPNAPPVCLDAIDLIKERAGKMFPGQPEFGSLLITANPPNLAANSIPVRRVSVHWGEVKLNAVTLKKISIEPNSYIAILFLGSDATVRVKPGNSKGKHRQGELTVQHGDVIGFKAGSEGIEVSVKMDNFGFFCIARHARPNETIPPHTATSESRLSIESFPPQLRSDSHPSSSVEPLSATISSFPNPTNEISHPQGATPKHLTKPNTPLFGGIKKPRKSAPPKNVKLAVMRLKNWYIGAYSLDPEQCLRILPPYSSRSAEVDQANIDEKRLIILNGISPEGESFEKFDPIPLSPLPGYDDLEPEPPTVPVPIPSKKSTPASKKSKISTVNVTPTTTSTPTSGKRKKGRPSTNNTPAGSVIDHEEEMGTTTPSVRSTGTLTPGASARGGKGGRGRGRGRKSLA